MQWCEHGACRLSFVLCVSVGPQNPALCEACGVDGPLDIVEYLTRVDHVNCNALGVTGLSALATACKKRWTSAVELLLQVSRLFARRCMLDRPRLHRSRACVVHVPLASYAPEPSRQP